MIKNIEVKFTKFTPYSRRILVHVKAQPVIPVMTVKAEMARPDGKVIHREHTWPSWRGGYLKVKDGAWPNIGAFYVGFPGGKLRGTWQVALQVLDDEKLVHEQNFDIEV